MLLTGAMPDFKNPFKSPDIFVKLRNDPRTADMLNDPEGMKLIQALQTNPNALGWVGQLYTSSICLKRKALQHSLAYLQSVIFGYL